MKKRFLSFLTAAVLCISLVPTAFAGLISVTYEQNVPGGTIVYEADPYREDTVWEVVWYTGNITEAPILDKIEYESPYYGRVSGPVTSIRQAFKGCTSLTSVTIPGSVTSISGGMFAGCTGLTSVTISDGVTSIDGEAFKDCIGLTSVTIPGSVTSIEYNAFEGCTGLTSVTISNGVTSIEWNAFKGCTGLTSVTIPGSVTSIGPSAFAGCTSLTSVTIREGVTSIGGYAFSGCTGLTSVMIPSSVTSIGEYAFKSCASLTSVTIPGSVASIEMSAFEGCTGLTSVTISNGVTSIDSEAFKDCVGLTSVTIPSSVTSIEYKTFAGCKSLTSVTIPSSVTLIQGDVFYDTALTDIYYGGSEEQWNAITIIAYDDNKKLVEATIHYNSPMPEVPDTPAEPAVAMPTNDSLTCNGAAQNPTVYKINDSNYFKIRDLAAILNGTGKQFAVGYDEALRSVTATTGKAYTMTDTELKGAPAGQKQAEISNDAIYIDGVKVDVEVYKIDGNNYFKLRDLGKAMGFYVGWTKEQGMFIETGRPYSE